MPGGVFFVCLLHSDRWQSACAAELHSPASETDPLNTAASGASGMDSVSEYGGEVRESLPRPETSGEYRSWGLRQLHPYALIQRQSHTCWWQASSPRTLIRAYDPEAR